MKSYKLKSGLAFAVIPGVGRVRDQILVGDYDRYVPALLEVVPSADGGTASVAPVVSARVQPVAPVPPPIVPVVPVKEEEPKSEEPKAAEEPKPEESKPPKGKKGRHE